MKILQLIIYSLFILSSNAQDNIGVHINIGKAGIEFPEHKQETMVLGFGCKAELYNPYVETDLLDDLFIGADLNITFPDSDYDSLDHNFNLNHKGYDSRLISFNIYIGKNISPRFGFYIGSAITARYLYEVLTYSDEEYIEDIKKRWNLGLKTGAMVYFTNTIFEGIYLNPSFMIDQHNYYFSLGMGYNFNN